VFPALAAGGDRPAVRFEGHTLTYGELAATCGRLADRLAGARRVAVWATPSPSTCVAVVAAVWAGVPAVPVNPRSGARELAHIVADSAPDLVLAAPSDELPEPLAALPRVDPLDVAGRAGDAADPGPDAPALVVYTSGTTGPPKGVVLPRRALTSNLDALAAAWAWTGDDELVHGLPLFHVHGLVLGVLGPLRLGGTVRHLGRFSTDGVVAAFGAGATMMFGVPTMYHRLVTEATTALADALRGARLLVSGSAALPVVDHERMSALSGQRVVERYGMTETLMNAAVRADGDRRPGHVGPAVDGVSLRLVDDAGAEVPADGETIGEIHVRGPNLFLEYLNRPDATADVLRDGWFTTGDVATMAPDGYLRIVGRRATDLIKSGGFKIGAGEIENVLLEHPCVAEVAVTGEPDPDLGERVVAWVVRARGTRPSAAALADHVAAELAPHKRPREVRFLDALPRNDLGKVTKKDLGPLSPHFS
jgi:malonyl-CoA/methylmalonyl-CoA synthetase